MQDPETDNGDGLPDFLSGEGSASELTPPAPVTTAAEVPDSEKEGSWYRRKTDGFKARIIDETWEAYSEATRDRWEKIPGLSQPHPTAVDTDEEE